MNTCHALPSTTLWSKGLAATFNAMAQAPVLSLCVAATLSTGCGNDSNEAAASATTASPTGGLVTATGQANAAEGGDNPVAAAPMVSSQPTASPSVQPSSGGTAAAGTGPENTPSAGMPTNASTGEAPNLGASGGAGGDMAGEVSGGGAGGDALAGGDAVSDGGATSGGGAGGVASDLGAGGGGDTGGDVPENATIVPDPDWACGMADGIPEPTLGELAFTITLEIRAEHEVGNTPYGYRRLLDVSGGTITGDRLQGSVLTGGLEYELTLSNGVMEYQGINVLETSAGRIFVRSCGVATDEGSMPRIIPDFEATTSGGNAFLNTGTWVATREVADGKMTLAVYDVSGVTPGEPRVEISKPEGVPPQPWECNMTGGTQGAEVLTENVTLGTSYSIANAKYGSRNIIPITGGTTTGRVTGSILNGGADYQLSGSLDAWYTLAPDNGELILVRNCGGGGGLIPWFEAAVDGEFDFLNTQAYLSSAPGIGGGGVTITFYERN